MPAPGEHHTFGLSMVAKFFARASWKVVGVMDPKSARLQDRVKHEWFDLVGMSAGCTTRLDALRASIALARRHPHNRAVAVMVGGPLLMLHAERVEQVGANAAAAAGRQAPSPAGRLLSRQVTAR